MKGVTPGEDFRELLWSPDTVPFVYGPKGPFCFGPLF